MIEKYRPFISCNNLALRIQHSQGTNMLTSIQHIKGDLSRVDNEMRGRPNVRLGLDTRSV